MYTPVSQITYNHSHVSRTLLDNDLKSWTFLRFVERVTSCEKTQGAALVPRDWACTLSKCVVVLSYPTPVFSVFWYVSLVRISWEAHRNMHWQTKTFLLNMSTILKYCASYNIPTLRLKHSLMSLLSNVDCSRDSACETAQWKYKHTWIATTQPCKGGVNTAV